MDEARGLGLETGSMANWMRLVMIDWDCENGEDECPGLAFARVCLTGLRDAIVVALEIQGRRRGVSRVGEHDHAERGPGERSTMGSFR